jgi:hypothetical protein
MPWRLIVEQWRLTLFLFMLAGYIEAHLGSVEARPGAMKDLPADIEAYSDLGRLTLESTGFILILEPWKLTKEQ